MVAHPFHIHDIEFYVLDINGNPPPPEYQGLKDVILVKPNDTVRFITQFTTFSNWFVPYMFHCHLLHHEDDGMMGTFLVVDSSTIGVNEVNKTQSLSIFPNPTSDNITIMYASDVANAEVILFNTMGEAVIRSRFNSRENILSLNNCKAGIYFLQFTDGDKVLTKKIIKQ